MRKKTEKSIKPRKPEKKITEKTESWKKPIRILKKLIGSVRFYKLETEKTEPNPNKKNRKKTEPNRKKTKPNRFEPVIVLKKLNRTETGRFEPVSFFFFLNEISVWLLFFDKNWTELKIITPNHFRARRE